MQYHVPFDQTDPSASRELRGVGGVDRAASSPPVVASSPTSSVQAPPSPLRPQQRGSAVGITVGQGLLSGRRLAVTTPPSPASRATPVAPNPAALSGSMKESSSHRHTGDSPAGLTPSNVCPPFSPHDASECPALMRNTTAGAVGPSPTYGKGIVRISELRRQGAPFVESGLRLATPDGRYSVATASSTHGIAARGGASGEGDVRDGGSTPKVMPSHRPTRRRDLPARAATTFSSASPSTRARAGRNSATSSGGGRRRGRGSNISGRSRSSLTVTLRGDGQLCDYRWFTARGRRCFVYDGRTYKGSSAHRMWEKVKEAARQRGVLPPPQVEAAARTFAASRAGGKADSGITHSTVAARTTASRSHQTSARARSAADRILTESTTRRPASGSRALSGELTGTGVLVPARLPEAWCTLMEELGLLPDDETGAITIGAEGNLLGSSGGTQPPATTSSTITRHSPPRRDHLSASRPGTEEVIEVTDSDSPSDGTGDSDSDTFSSLSSTASPTEVRNNSDSAQRSVNTLATGAPLQWPTTSYFSDASSGWSSTSSFTAPPAHPPSSKSTDSPKRKRGRPEHCKDQAVIATAGARARLRSYKGVQVVEKDGWVYPAELFASQQQQRQCGSAPVKEAASGKASSGALLLAANGRRTGDNGSPRSDLCGVDDLPLADVYKDSITARRRVTSVPQPSRPALLAAPLPSVKASSGLSVVSGSGVAVPVRPATAPGGTQASLLSTAVALGKNLVRGGGVSAFLGTDDNLDDFSAADLADMFVTGEEIGGLRYDG
ncbi:hypothetical protein JIQ42_03087 [Leishmania sp. Namibia]|uniref:hypothetical protein n=1 Tax=Leishmania sp. Namibia TaxID=2802991 RepID=UPI001B48B2B7|nr:hypothetical protein JIQ42_03087 [Leishmania sp. Namibia]